MLAPILSHLEDKGCGNPRLTTGFSVVGLLVQGDRVYASDSGDRVRVALRQSGGDYRWEGQIELIRPPVGGPALPTGMAWQSEGELWVASCRGNSVQLVNRIHGQVEQIVPVGIAPYSRRRATPCDHTTGTRPDSPTPRAMIADNDLALGQIVDAVTRSKFWPETCMFVWTYPGRRCATASRICRT